jgi:hypothetical protein
MLALSTAQHKYPAHHPAVTLLALEVVIGIMATTSVFLLPMDQTPRYSLDPLRMNVLKFDLTGDLLATADSDRNLQVYSFSQNTFVFRRRYRSPIFAIEWKSTWSYLSVLGRCTLYLGFGDGSIEELTFPSKITTVSDITAQMTYCSLIHILNSTILRARQSVPRSAAA